MPYMEMARYTTTWFSHCLMSKITPETLTAFMPQGNMKVKIVIFQPCATDVNQGPICLPSPYLFHRHQN